MAAPVLDIDDVQIPADAYRANRDRQRLEHVEECFRCARGLTASALGRAWYVHQTTDGYLVNTDAQVPLEQDQGWFPLGSECARAIPPEFRARLAAI